MVDMEDEFSRLLAHQLLSQDRFFAERVATAEKTCRETVAGLGVEAEAVQRRLEATRRELSEMRDRRLAATARGATVAGEFEALLAAFRDVTKVQSNVNRGERGAGTLVTLILLGECSRRCCAYPSLQPSSRDSPINVTDPPPSCSLLGTQSVSASIPAIAGASRRP